MLDIFDGGDRGREASLLNGYLTFLKFDHGCGQRIFLAFGELYLHKAISNQQMVSVWYCIPVYVVVRLIT